MELNLPKAYKELFSNNYRYFVYYGGRGSAKSWSIVRFLLLKCLTERCKILCCREIQRSIKDSVHSLLRLQIDQLGLNSKFIINDTSITCITGSEIIFAGLYQNLDNIKSIENIKYCYIEEAQSTSEESLQVLFPTIRLQDSKIFISFNPEYEDDAVYNRFILNTPSNALVNKVSYKDNPYLSTTALEERENDLKYRPEDYKWIWDGECRKIKRGQIYTKFDNLNIISVKDMILSPFREVIGGIDIGFTEDNPFALVVRVITPTEDYQVAEYVKSNLTAPERVSIISQFNKKFKVSKWVCDSAHPDDIQLIKDAGINCIPVIKDKNSVEFGISLHSDLINHKKHKILDSCIETINDYKNYCWSTTKRNTPKHEHCHLMDATRYVTMSIKDIHKDLQSKEHFKSLDFDFAKHDFLTYFTGDNKQYKEDIMNKFNIDDYGKAIINDDNDEFGYSNSNCILDD